MVLWAALFVQGALDEGHADQVRAFHVSLWRPCAAWRYYSAIIWWYGEEGTSCCQKENGFSGQSPHLAVPSRRRYSSRAPLTERTWREASLLGHNRFPGQSLVAVQNCCSQSSPRLQLHILVMPPAACDCRPALPVMSVCVVELIKEQLQKTNRPAVAQGTAAQSRRTLLESSEQQQLADLLGAAVQEAAATPSAVQQQPQPRWQPRSWEDGVRRKTSPACVHAARHVHGAGCTAMALQH